MRDEGAGCTRFVSVLRRGEGQRDRRDASAALLSDLGRGLREGGEDDARTGAVGVLGLPPGTAYRTADPLGRRGSRSGSRGGGRGGLVVGKSYLVPEDKRGVLLDPHARVGADLGLEHT